MKEKKERKKKREKRQRGGEREEMGIAKNLPCRFGNTRYAEKKGREIGELLKGRRCKRCWIRKSAKINMQSEQKQKEGRKLCPAEKSWAQYKARTRKLQ